MTGPDLVAGRLGDTGGCGLEDDVVVDLVRGVIHEKLEGELAVTLNVFQIQLVSLSLLDGLDLAGL